jgi:hypothetical protein
LEKQKKMTECVVKKFAKIMPEVGAAQVAGVRKKGMAGLTIRVLDLKVILKNKQT